VPTLGKNQPFECFKANPFSALPLKSALPRSDEIFGLAPRWAMDDLMFVIPEPETAGLVVLGPLAGIASRRQRDSEGYNKASAAMPRDNQRPTADLPRQRGSRRSGLALSPGEPGADRQ